MLATATAGDSEPLSPENAPNQQAGKSPQIVSNGLLEPPATNHTRTPPKPVLSHSVPV